MPEVAQATIVVTPVLSGAQESLTDQLTDAAGGAGASAGTAAGTSMTQSISKSMTGAGTTLTKGVTVPLTAIGTAAVASWKEVDSGLDTIVKKTGASGDALDDMHGILNDIATSIPVDFETAGSAIGEVNTRFGVTGGELEDLSGKFIKFAKLNDQDVSSSVDSVSKMMAAFGMETEDAGKVLDALNVVGQQTGVDVGSLSDTVAANAAQFQAMGLSAYDAASFIGMASMAGLDSSTAMMGLKTAMKNATEEGVTLDEALAGFEETMNSNASESDKLAAAYELFGTRAGAAIANAVENGELDLDDFTTSLGDFEGSVDDTFEGTIGPMDEFQNTLNELKIVGEEIVEAAGPALSDILSGIAGAAETLTSAWESLSPQMQDAVIRFAMVAAVAGPLMVGVGKIAGAFTSIKGVFTGGKIGKGISQAGTAASQASGPVSTAAGSFGTMAGQALKMVAAAAALWIAAQAISVLVDAAIRITEAGGPAVAVLAGMGAGIVGLMAAAAALGPALTAGALGIGVFGAAMLGIGAGIDLACQGIAKVTEAIIGLVETIATNADQINSIITTVGETVSGIVGSIASGISQVVDSVAGGVSDVVSSVGEAVSSVFDSISGGASQIIESVGECVATVGESVSGVIETITDGVTQVIDAISGGISGVLESLSSVIDSIGGAALNAGTGFEKLADAIIKLTNNTGVFDLAATLTAVAGGVAAVTNAASGAGDSAPKINSLTTALKTLGTTGISTGQSMTRFGTMTNSAMTQAGRALTTAGTQTTRFATTTRTAMTTVSTSLRTAGTASTQFTSTVRMSMSGATSALNSGETSMSSFASSVSASMRSAQAAFRSLDFASSLRSALSNAVSAARSGLNSLQSAFSNTRLSFYQHIKVPHFSMSGSFNAQKGTVPKVSTSWYRVAESNPYLFTGATLFGAGEHDDEILYGRDKLLSDIAIASGNKERSAQLNAITRMINGMYELMQDGQTITIGKRDFARLVYEVS